MKQLIVFFLALNLISINNHLSAQSVDESSGLLGDNFSLEGALSLFEKATSLESFEEQINDQTTTVNNLDLNDDGEIDYIRVEDHQEGDIHVIILQALISKEESQDIAVIEIERTGDESATLQIVGDSYLYGDDHIVEPFEEVATSTGNGGPSADYTISAIIVNVWLWPSVRHIYRPNYVVYRSPFRWRVYPRAWRPWRPLTWNVYRNNRISYNQRCRAVKTRRIVNARRIYTPNRRSSTTVVKRSKSVTRVRSTNGGKTKRSKSTTVNKNRSVKTNRSKSTKKGTKKQGRKKKSGN